MTLQLAAITPEQATMTSQQAPMLSTDDTDDVIQNDEQRPLPGNASESCNSRLADGNAGIWRCIKNLVLHCVSVLLVFTSFLSLQNLESSLNHEYGLGVVSMACLYGGRVAICLFSPIIIRKTGYKWSMVACFCAQIGFAIANFYPRFYTLIPACVLVGLTIGPFWTAQGLFITTLAVQYGGYVTTDPNILISRFNGIFYTFLQSSQVWGNVISSVIMTSTNDVIWNVTYSINETCGASFCHFPPDTLSRDNSKTPVTILLCVYLGCCVTGVLIKVIFVDNITPLPQRQGTGLTVGETITSTFRIQCNKKVGFLIPLMVYLGMEQVFLYGDFTQAFVTCELGIGYVGYSMITFGAVSTVSSFLVGQLEKYTGRIIMFLASAVIQLGMLVLMLVWNPGHGTNDDWLLYFIPGLWGLADSIWQITLLTLLAVEFKQERDAAFATFRFWQGIGMGSAFAYSFFLCMRIKLYITMSTLVISMVLYITMELNMRCKNNQSQLGVYVSITE